MENLSTMRTEILSLYSQRGGSIAVRKSQLVSLSPKEILEMAETCFGQMHTLVACLEVRPGDCRNTWPGNDGEEQGSGVPRST